MSSFFNTIVYEDKISKQLDTMIFEFTASASGNSWFGIKKNNKETSNFILDDITVHEITKNP